MNTLQKLIGTNGTFLLVGHTVTPMPVGFAAYALIVAVNGTIIDEYDEIDSELAVTTVDDASWCGVALSRGDYISLASPVVTLTLTADADSVWCYLVPTDYVAPGE